MAQRYSARVEGNARLTGATAAVLFVLLAAEGVTVLRVHALLTAHVVIGLLLVPPILLKVGSTTWKFSRYYLGDPAYRKQGPPSTVLRVLGPFVVVLTVLLFASGIWLLLQPNGFGGRLLEVHKASFILWVAATAVHVLGHLADTVRLAPRDWRRRTRRLAPGGRTRQGAVFASLAVGLVLALALKGHVPTFLHDHGGHGFRKGP
jgi:hypothetical protein